MKNQINTYVVNLYSKKQASPVATVRIVGSSKSEVIATVKRHYGQKIGIRGVATLED